MIELHELLWGFSIISLVLYSLQGLSISIRPAASPPLCSWLTGFFTSPPAFVGQENQHSEMEAKVLHDKILCREEEAMKKDHENCNVVGMKVGGGSKLRKRPGRLVVPEICPVLEFGDMGRKLAGDKEFEVEGRDYFLVSKKGRREIMEDGYDVMLDLLGDPKQAFFAVIDGHGGRAAADYVAENLGKNIVKALENVVGEEDKLEEAIRGGFLVTDREFLSQGAGSGACAVSVVLKEGELHVANVGDCRVVLSKKGVASALTDQHRLNREDERLRIENSGGYVHCRNGVWRVQGSLAVSRAIGDLHLKDLIISEPEIRRLHITSDCEFLIMASDGLWDKVKDQEAVDVVSKEKSSVKCCRELVDISCSRGNMDDITVMVINLQTFLPTTH